MKQIYYIILLLCLLGGTWLYKTSLQYSWYTVSRQELGKLSQGLANDPRDERWHQWFIKKAQLETPRKILHDTGIGLVSFAVTFIIFCFVYDFPLRKARTPNRKRSFMLIYLLALAIQVPNSMFYFTHRLMRCEYPPWGDSIFIGIFHTALACVIFGGIGLLIFRDILRKALFPADIYIWSKSNPIFCSVITAIFGILALLCMFSVTNSVRVGSVGGVIMKVTMLYLFMSIRAGMINYRMNKKTETKTTPETPDAIKED